MSPSKHGGGFSRVRSPRKPNPIMYSFRKLDVRLLDCVPEDLPMFRGVPIIDADSHKIENPAIFLEYLEPRYRPRVRQVTDRHGEPRVAITDRNPHTGALDLERL